MRIAYDFQIFYSQIYGGVSRYFYNLIQQTKQKHQIKIFSPSYINQYINAFPAEIVHGYYRRSYPPKTAPLFRIYNTFAACSQIKKWKPDILHETYYSPIRTGHHTIPSVLTVYDMIHERFSQHFPFLEITRFNKKRAIERASHIICISNSTRRDLLELFDIPPEKVSMIHLGYEKSQSKKTDQISAIPFSDSKPYILYVGQRSIYKNFDRFLKAFASSQQIFNQFNIICFGGNEFNNNELNLINKLKLKKHIKQFSGNDKILEQAYRSASLFIYPSLYEGFGLPLLEAMAYGCPIACSNNSSMPEVVGKAAELFDPIDIDSICTAMESILFSTERYEELIKIGCQRLTNFTWKKCADKTIQIYEQVKDIS